MQSGRHNLRRQEVGHHSFNHGGRRESIRAAAEARLFITAVTEAMAAAGYPAADIFGMHLALAEAIANAIKHGHHGDLKKPVQIRYAVNRRRVIAEIEDQGVGFDPKQVPDPRAPENLERPSGRGLLLIRHYMTEVRFNRRGNRITLFKSRSGPRRNDEQGVKPCWC